MITTIEELKVTIPTITGTDFGIYKSSIDQAYRWIERDILGATITVANDAVLSKKIDLAVAYRAYREIVPMLDLINNGTGFVVINNDNHSPASRERVAALVASMDRALNDALTDIYEYIEDREMLATEFAEFSGSTIINGSLLPTLRQFRNYGVFTGGYADWIVSRSKHRRIISLQFNPRFTEALICAVLVDPLADRFTEIIDPLRYAFAALITEDNNTAQAMFTSVENELLAHSDKYPEYIKTGLKSFDSTSTISFL